MNSQTLIDIEKILEGFQQVVYKLRLERQIKEQKENKINNDIKKENNIPRFATSIDLNIPVSNSVFPETDRYYSIKQIKKNISISSSTIYRLFSEGKLKKTYIGGRRISIKGSDIIEWLKKMQK